MPYTINAVNLSDLTTDSDFIDFVQASITWGDDKVSFTLINKEELINLASEYYGKDVNNEVVKTVADDTFINIEC